jgi:hypothetical protein
MTAITSTRRHDCTILTTLHDLMFLSCMLCILMAPVLFCFGLLLFSFFLEGVGRLGGESDIPLVLHVFWYFCWFYEAHHVSLIHAICTVLVEVLRRCTCLQTSMEGLQHCICIMWSTIVFESAILSSYFWLTLRLVRSRWAD